MSLEHWCLTVAHLFNRAVAGHSNADVMTPVAWLAAWACHLGLKKRKKEKKKREEACFVFKCPDAFIFKIECDFFFPSVI